MNRRIRKAAFAVLVAGSTVLAGIEALAPVDPADAAVTQVDHAKTAKIINAPRARIEARLKWDIQHIRQLQQRRTYLKHYIRDLRAKLHPVTTSSPTSSSSTSSSTSSYSGGVLTATQVANYARAAGFPESAISTMVYYASRESGFNPRAINASSGACGLWQLYPCLGGSAWLDPATNARLAYQKYQASGFSPWGG